MTKILHASFLKRPIAGIINQLHHEELASADLRLQFDTRVFIIESTDAQSPSGNLVVAPKPHRHSSSKAFSWALERLSYSIWLIKNARDYDIILARWNMYDPFFSIALMCLKGKVYTVHHTKEENELQMQRPLGAVKAFFDRVFFKFSANFLLGVVGVTDEIVEYEKLRAGKDLRTIVYPNGIFIEKEHTICGKICDGDVPRLLFIASNFAAWHGLDLLLESTSKTNEAFELNVVGKAPDDLVDRFKGDPRIFFHGLKNNVFLSDISMRCDIGISSLALNRKGMRQACTLKVREYLMHGLPVYSGYDDVFEKEFRFYRKGPPDIRCILSFAKENAEVMRQEVLSASIKKIGKSELLDRLCCSLSENLNQ